MCPTLQGAGIIGSLVKAEQKVAEQGEKLWKKLPGITKKKKRCRIHLQAGSLDARSLCLAWQHAVRLPTNHQRFGCTLLHVSYARSNQNRA